MFNAIVFDLDGTLVNTHNHIHYCFSHALEPFDLKASKELFEKIRHQSTHELFSGFLPDDHAQQARNRLKEITFESLHHVEIYPGILELIEKLRQRDVPLAVWTGRDGNSAVEILKANSIFHHFDKLVASCHVKNNKPSPDGLNEIIKELQFNPNLTLMIGDHLHDLEGARGAGCKAGLAKWGIQDLVIPNGFDFIFNNPDDILNL